MKLRKYLLILFIIPLTAFSVHKYYISLCEIEHNEKQNSVQITLGMFIDDIELTLNKNHKTKLNIATVDEYSAIDQYFEEYLNKHFIITINNKLKAYEYIGKEYEDDIVRFYLEIPYIEHIQSISVKNTSLIKFFEDQQNIIKIKANQKHKTFYLNKQNDKGLLNFKN